MKNLGLKFLTRLRQTGQGMTEFILILAAVGIGGIFTYTQFGDVLRHQTVASAKALTGLDGKGLTDAAREIAVTASAGASRNVGNFAGFNSYGDYTGNDSDAGNADNAEGTNDDGGALEPGAGTPEGGDETSSTEDDSYAPEGQSTEPTVPESFESMNARRARDRVNKDPMNEPTVRELVNKSPALRDALAHLRHGQSEGVEIKYWDQGYSTGTNKLVQISANAGNEVGVVQVLSHEIGHALYYASHGGRPSNTSTEEAYVQSRLENEAAAVIMNIKVRQDLLDATRNDPWATDIGIIGAYEHRKEEYIAIYNQYKGDEATARTKIAELWADEPHPRGGTYRSRNAQDYRDIFPARG